MIVFRLILLTPSVMTWSPNQMRINKAMRVFNTRDRSHRSAGVSFFDASIFSGSAVNSLYSSSLISTAFSFLGMSK